MLGDVRGQSGTRTAPAILDAVRSLVRISPTSSSPMCSVAMDFAPRPEFLDSRARYGASQPSRDPGLLYRSTRMRGRTESRRGGALIGISAHATSRDLAWRDQRRSSAGGRTVDLQSQRVAVREGGEGRRGAVAHVIIADIPNEEQGTPRSFKHISRWGSMKKSCSTWRIDSACDGGRGRPSTRSG